MPIIDQPGKFYLGYEYDLDQHSVTDTPFLTYMRELTSHAICLGAAGTGKTGLGICLVEEALWQGVPVIIIDTKGDVAPWALSFSNPAQAGNVAMPSHEEESEIDFHENRMRELRNRVKVDIYTPGSDTGIGMNMLEGMNPPGRATGLTWERNANALREQIAQVVTALLDLAGITSEPLKDREHILLSTIFETTWRVGQSIDIHLLIRMIQQPPVARIGLFDMNVFYPRTERFDLAMALSNLFASPSFKVLGTGQSLDVTALLKPVRGGSNPAGSTRASLFSLAHLNEAERRFFMASLLSQVVLWMRAQPATSVLRCLVYIDEVLDYLPPAPNDIPTKAPLQTILKQGPSSGLGMMIGTRNPAGIDYKELSLLGMWFLGRMDSAQDRAHLFEGLARAGVVVDLADDDAILSALPPRVFLTHSAHAAVRVFQTRNTGESN